jgi:hypothetical protein
VSWKEIARDGWPESGQDFWIYGPNIPVQLATLEHSKYRPSGKLFYTYGDGGLLDGEVTHYQQIIKPEPPKEVANGN